MESERLSFEEARARLRERGYLDRGVEGAVLKGALAARSRAASLVRGAAVAALLLASALAAAATVLTGVRSELGARDVLVLFAYVLVPAIVLAALLVGVLVVVVTVRLRGRGGADVISTELGIAFGLVAGVAGALAARPTLEAAGPAAAAAVLAAVAVAVFLADRIARGVALTVLYAAGRAAIADRRRAGAAAVVLALLAAPAAVILSRQPLAPVTEPLVVTATGKRVVLVGVDGWSDRYLPAGGSLPGVRVTYRREKVDPAAFWTTVATGERPSRHGVGSLDLVRLAGMSRAVHPLPGGTWYAGSLLPRLGFSHREPATAAARRVPAIWDVSERAGIPTLVVGWWTTWPAVESRATVLSNHLYFAARTGAPLAREGWPIEAVGRVALLAPPVTSAPGSLERLVEDAEGLDSFSIEAFREMRRAESPRLSLLYLPGPDILAAALADSSRSTAERVAIASALAAEAGRIAEFLGSKELAEGADLLVLVLDGGRGERGGSLRLAGALAGTGTGPSDPIDLTPTLLASLGVPASREAAGRVRPELLAPGAATGATVASWGHRPPITREGADARAYVENLRSLGYLR